MSSWADGENDLADCKNMKYRVELGKIFKCFLPLLRSLFLTKTLKNAFQNTFQLSFCFRVSNPRQARKIGAFILAVETGRGRWIPKSLGQLGLLSEFRARTSTKILNSFKPVSNTEWKIKGIFVFWNLSNLTLTPYVAVACQAGSFRDVTNSCFAKPRARQQSRGASTVQTVSLGPQGRWQGWGGLHGQCPRPGCRLTCSPERSSFSLFPSYL